MEFTRRQLLSSFSASGIALVAGCSEEGEVSGEDGDGDSNEPDGAEKTDEETPGQRDSKEFQLGETGVYTHSDGEKLEFTPQEAIIQEGIFYTRSGNRIHSEKPESSNQIYLSIRIDMKNVGDKETSAPGTLNLTIDGTQYETKYTSAYSDNEYDAHASITPASTISGWATFAIPENASQAKFIAQISTYSDELYGEWSINLEEVPRESYDYSKLGIGEEATVSAGEKEYSITAVDSTEKSSYIYGDDDYEFEEEASDGNKYVFVTVRAQNTGQGTVYVPTSYGMSLIANSSEYETEGYLNDDKGYEGGDISSGIKREGIILFEIPQSVSSYTFQTALTDEFTATWEL